MAEAEATLAVPPLKFRRLCVDDLEAIKALHEEWFPVRYSAAFYDAAVRERMVGTAEPLYTLVAEDARTLEIVGLVTAQLTDAETCGDALFEPSDEFLEAECARVMYVLTLGSASRYRRRGIAKELLRRCVRRAVDEAHCGAVYLHVITYNVAAIDFYEKNDFTRLRMIADYYRIDGVSYACYVYALFLSRARVDGRGATSDGRGRAAHDDDAQRGDLTSYITGALARAALVVPAAWRSCIRPRKFPEAPAPPPPAGLPSARS